jgi:hypothetical protein
LDCENHVSEVEYVATVDLRTFLNCNYWAVKTHRT